MHHVFVWVYDELLRLCTNVWLEPININTLRYLWTSAPALPVPRVDTKFHVFHTIVIELREFNKK